jgi:hypothetical protein
LTHFALTGELQPETVFDAAWDVQVEAAARTHSTLPSAVDAWRGNRLTVALARVTRSRSQHVAKQRANLALDLTSPATDVTGLESCSGLAATSLAGSAENGGVDFHDPLNAKNGITQAEVNPQESILAALNPAARATLSPAEERVKNVSETEPTSLAERVLTAHVIVSSLVWVA